MQRLMHYHQIQVKLSINVKDQQFGTGAPAEKGLKTTGCIISSNKDCEKDLLASHATRITKRDDASAGAPEFGKLRIKHIAENKAV